MWSRVRAETRCGDSSNFSPNSSSGTIPRHLRTDARCSRGTSTAFGPKPPFFGKVQKKHGHCFCPVSSEELAMPIKQKEQPFPCAQAREGDEGSAPRRRRPREPAPSCASGRGARRGLLSSGPSPASGRPCG